MTRLVGSAWTAWSRKHHTTRAGGVSITINIGSRRRIIKCNIEMATQERSVSCHDQAQLTRHLSVDFKRAACIYSVKRTRMVRSARH